MSEPKLHHWWPVFHQRHWTDSNGRVHVVRKDKAYAVSPPNNAAIRDDNTLVESDGTKNREVEKWFADHVEGPAATALASLERFRTASVRRLPAPQAAPRIGGVTNGTVGIRDVTITASEREALGRYMASLVVRVPSYRYQISGVLSSLRKRAKVERGVKIPEPSFTEDRNSQIQWMVNHLEDFGRVIARSFWMAFESPSSDRFIIGDTPVLPYHEPDRRLSYVLPVFPDLVISVLNHPQGNPTNTTVPVIQCGKELVSDYNEKSVRQSRMAVFSNATPGAALLALVAAKLDTFRPQIGDPSEAGVQHWLDELSGS